MVAPVGTPRDLQIQQAVPKPIPSHQFAHHNAQRCRIHRHRHIQRAEAAAQPFAMAGFIDQMTVQNRTNFVHGICKLQAAVLDMHAGQPVRSIAAIEIRNPPGRDRMTMITCHASNA
jgi:hypothetical protein